VPQCVSADARETREFTGLHGVSLSNRAYTPETISGSRITSAASATKLAAWVRNHENIFVIGPCGVGKSFLASALAQKACRDGHSALYLRAAALLRELALARADGSLRHLLARLSRIEVLVIDDWAMAPLNESERREVWEICEDRYQTRSTVLTSQLPVSRWHEQIGDPTIADGILDRLVHNAHRIEMRGESMRKNRNPPRDPSPECFPSSI
jgi:DNA replication protein DnaC